MADRIVLHVGTMKTGTSFVQSVLQAHPDELAAGGVEFLRGFPAQTMAVKGVLRLPAAPDDNLKKWRTLARTARRSSAVTGIVSMEFLGFAGRKQVRAAIAELEGLEVSVVVTVRDQALVVGAQWQTYVRNFGTASWADYLADIRAATGESRAWRTFHRAQDVPRVLDHWGAGGADELTCVTLPPPGGPRDALWDRFCEAARIEVPGIDVSGVRDNPSVGYGACEVLRLLNGHLQELSPKSYRKVVRPLARETLVPLRGQDTRPALDAAAGAWALHRNQQVRDAIKPHRLVGSAEDLPTSGSDWPAGVVPPQREQVLAAARAAWGHARELAKVDAETPDDLDALVDGTARMLLEVAS